MGTARRVHQRSIGRLAAGGVIVACIGVLGASVPLVSQALERARRDANAHAVAYVDQVITPVLEDRPTTGSLTTDEVMKLRSRVRERSSDHVDGLWLWTTTGDLLYNTERTTSEATPEGVRGARRGAVPSSFTGAGSGRTLHTFVPVPAGDHPSAVAQIAQWYAPIEADVQDRWNTIRTGAGGIAALALAFLLLNFARSRRGRARDPGFAARERSGGAGRDTEELERRLKKSEEARTALEDQLAQLRTQTAEAEARGAERVAVFSSQVVEGEARAKELEGMLRDAEARAVRAVHETPFTDAAPGNDEGARSQRQLAEAEQELRETRAKLEELEPLVERSAARVQDVEARATRDARAADARLHEVQTIAADQERRLHAAEARVVELETYARDMEKRLATTKESSDGSALRIRELQGQLEGARHDGEAAIRRAEEAEARLETLEERASGEGDGGRAALADELAAAHRAGMEAFRLMQEGRDELEATKAELERVRRELDQTRQAEPGVTETPDEATAPRQEIATEEFASKKSAPDEESAPEDIAPEENGEGRGPSLRFRLAHSAAQRKGQAKVKERDELRSP